jgi:hypothetical protein
MSLFDNSLLDKYKSDERIKQMLNGCELLNLEDFMNWYLPDKSRRRSTRLQQNSAYKMADQTRRKKEENDMYILSMTLLQDLATAVCGKNTIGKNYGRSSIVNAVSNPEFDFLVAVDMDLPQSNAKQRISSVVAFLAAEKGECFESEPGIDRSNVYSVNLICCKQNKHTVKQIKTVKSVVLLGAYMYCIKNNSNVAPKDKIGILELAGAYVNLSGFFAYTKVGFDKDNSLFGKYCFPDAGNLAMSVDVRKYTNEDIFGMVTGTKKRDPLGIKDDTGIYKLGLPDSDHSPEAQKQALVARISSLKHMMEFDYNKVNNTPHLKSFKDSILNINNSSKKYLTAREEAQAVQEYLDIEHAEYKKLMNKKNKSQASAPECDNNDYSCAISGGRNKSRKRKPRMKKTTRRRR